MIINKISNIYDGTDRKVSLDVDVYDCELSLLEDSIGENINICDMCKDCYNEQEYREPYFGGAFYDEEGDLIYIERVIYSKPAIIVEWSDGVRTKSTCHKDDTWNPELGLSLCVMKRLMGQTFVNNLMRDWSISSDTTNMKVTLKDVRRNHKEEEESKKLAKVLKLN